LIEEKVIEDISFPLGLEVVQAKRGWGSFLTFDFIIHKENFSEKTNRTFMLWVYLCDWEIYLGDNLVLDCDETDDRSYEEVLFHFQHIKLLDININLDDFSVQFIFENDRLLSLETDLDCYEKSDDLFMLFDHTLGTVISISPERGIYSELSSEIPINGGRV